jgi:hypothetical protein
MKRLGEENPFLPGYFSDLWTGSSRVLLTADRLLAVRHLYPSKQHALLLDRPQGESLLN